MAVVSVWMVPEWQRTWIKGLHHCFDCGAYRDVIYIPDEECGGVHSWWACPRCRGVR